MKNRTPLILMELVVMLLVFAIGAALCLRAFSWADNVSREEAARDHAYLQIQNAAELLRSNRGDFAAAAEILGGQWDGKIWSIYWDDGWNMIHQPGAYTLRAKPVESGAAYLGGATLEILRPDGECLVSLNICWQEVAP